MSVAPPGTPTPIHHEIAVSDVSGGEVVQESHVGDRVAAFNQTERIWAGVAFAACVIGSLGPWATMGVFSKAGTDGDGVITLILGIVGATVVLSNRGAHKVRVVVGAIGLLILAVGVFDIADVSSTSAELLGEEIGPSVGWGLWLVALGGLAAAVCPFARRFGLVKDS